MIDKLTPEDAAKLNKIYSLSSELYRLLEDIRPAGGWTERIDSKYCKLCGKEHIQ